MEIRTLITFLRVAELRSFSRAAAQLGYSQAAVTIQIRQLEEELGVQLFERIGKKVRLTEEGRNLIPRAIDVMNAVRAVRDLGRGDEPAGQLRLGTAESLLISVLPPVMMEFCRRCPKVEFSTCTDMVTGLFDMVRQNDIDVLYFLDRRTNFPEWVKVAERRERALQALRRRVVMPGTAAHPVHPLSFRTEKRTHGHIFNTRHARGRTGWYTLRSTADRCPDAGCRPRIGRRMWGGKGTPRWTPAWPLR